MVLEEPRLESAMIVGSPGVIRGHGGSLLLFADRLAVENFGVVVLEIDGVEGLDERKVKH